MTIWAVQWTGLMPIGNVELIEADSAEEALEITHRKITARYASDLTPDELQIERPVEMGP